MNARTFAALAIWLLLLAGVSECPAASQWWTDAPPEEILAELPMDLERAKADWEFPQGLSVVEDDLLGRKVLETPAGQSLIWSRRAMEEPLEVSALLRIPKPTGIVASLFCGARDKPALRDFAYVLSGNGQSFYPDAGGLMDKLLRPNGENVKSFPGPMTLYPRFQTISPVWDEEYRLEIESAMARYASFAQTWFRLRIVAWDDRVEMYKDGLCLGEYQPALRVQGNVALRLLAPVRVGSLTVRRLSPEQERFCPAGLEDRCNARAVGGTEGVSLQEAALPAPGRRVLIGGVPFVFPERLAGLDHIDVGESLFHYRKTSDNPDMNTLWPSPMLLDGGRIMLALPNRAYGRAWVVAASDDEPNSVPTVTVRFFRPHAGFSMDASGEAPPFTASRSKLKDARPLTVKTVAGQRANLWLIPIELDSQRIASELREFPTLSVELTKAVQPYRNYPDPCDYGYFQGGLPSGVRIFALTFEEGPVRMIASGNRAGNAYVLPECPVWQVSLANLLDSPVEGTLRLSTTDPYGKLESKLERRADLPPKGTSRLEFPLRPALLGLYQVKTEFLLTGGGGASKPKAYVQTGAFAQVPPDTRKTNQSNSRWGFWNWLGGHGTNPNPDENAYLMRACGARGVMRDTKTRQKWGLFPWPAIIGRAPAWAFKDPYDPAEYEKHSKEMGEAVLNQLKETPEGTYFCYFGENAVSMRATYGTYPEYIGEGEIVYTEDEKRTIRGYSLAAKACFEGVRKAAPQARISFGWCFPQFVIPFLREKFPKELFDAIGLDTPTFERMPEMPPYDVAPSKQWVLKEEMKKHGYADKPIIHTESYFPSSHELALGHRMSADYYVRTAVLSLAWGSTRLMTCFTLFDCSNYWGAQHYGCIGVIGRRPEFNPKPAFVAYATMTRMLDLIEFDGYVRTGSISSHCVRFKNLDTSLPHRHVYCLWTLRGKRDAVLTFQAGKDGAAAAAALTDENGNETKLALVSHAATVTLGQTALWVTSNLPMEKVELAPARYSEAPGPHVKPLDGFDAAWTYDPGDYERFSKAYPTRFITYPGPMRSEVVDSAERTGKVWRVTLDTPEKERPLAAWFGVFRPKAPVEIPGRARGLGIWANGCSDWGRIVYEIQDAKGETFISVGQSESWNSNDNYQWSYFNFDGWRYIEFPLPTNLPGDAYREKDSVWWGHDQEGVVDLPVKLTRIIIEHRTHNVYVHELVRAPQAAVDLDDLIAVYDGPEMMTDAPIKLQREAAMRPRPTGGKSLPNPIAVLKESGAAAATSIERLCKPEVGYEGKQIMAQIKAVEGATEYRVYVSAYESGAGAQVLAKSKEPVVQVSGLRPEVPLYFFVTFVDAANKESKPSAATKVLLKDDFPFK